MSIFGFIALLPYFPERVTASKVLMTEVGGTAVPCWRKVRNVVVFMLNFQSIKKGVILIGRKHQWKGKIKSPP